MKNRLALVMGMGVALSGALAHADGAPSGGPDFDPEDAVAPLSLVEGPGVKLGEDTVVHPIVGMETGYNSNLFFQDSNGVGGGLLRLLAEVGAGSLSPQRMALNSAGTGRNLGEFVYRADLRASYDFLLSGNEAVAAQGGLGAGALIRGMVHPMQTWRFGFQEDFERVLRATNFESRSNTNRDVNLLSLSLGFHPDGRSLSGVLHFSNRIDLFEASTQQFADRMQSTLGVRVDYQWLPLTRVFADVSGGLFTGIGSSTKASSTPMMGIVGIQTALTVKTGVTTRAGYTYSPYSMGPGYSAVVFGADFGYQYSPIGHLAATYSYNHEDSINANYFRDHLFKVALSQQFVPFVVNVEAEVQLRHYEGITLVTGAPTRDDVILSGLGELHYNLRDWLATTIDYHVTSISTPYTYSIMGVPTNPGYVRHEVLAGVRAAF